MKQSTGTAAGLTDFLAFTNLTAGRLCRQLVYWTLLYFCLSACTLVKIQGDAKTFYSSTVLVGRVTSAIPWDKPVVVAAYAKRDGQLKIEHYIVLHEAGSYEFIVPKGEYLIFAFGDMNANLKRDVGEPVGQYGPAPVVASGSGTVVELNFVTSNLDQAQFPVGTAISKSLSATPYSTQVGAIADLDEPVFSAAFGQGGYWAPNEFFQAAGGNIYFLEKYDPTRIPVLFVHGAAGSPQDWRYFFDHLDRKRFQPWFFYYPSGASLDSISYLLFWKLVNLQRIHQFDSLYFTAHSMGGLVVRNFLGNHGAQFRSAKLFISLSTPWGGDAMAELGVQYSPAVVPSWNDVQANGRFIQKLYQHPLPRDVDYYLFFGHGGGYSLLRSANTDGAVTLASELRPLAQAEAKMVYGFDEDHTGILRSPQVFARYASLLDSAAKKTKDAPALLDGHLRVAFSYDGVLGGVPPVEPWLILTPDDAALGRIILPISLRDSGRQLGPFPPGIYEISLMSHAFKTTPARLKVAVGTDQTPDLRFSLAPIGVLSGYIGADIKTIGNPAGSYREPRRDFVIESITLFDGRESRTLLPDRSPKDHTIENYLAGQDYAFQSAFSFVGLRDGDYELTIKAAGYQTHRQTVHVNAGQFGQLVPIDMKPLQR
jgi:pimeloyl-ACP methyl ester carboxylesterase